MNALDEQAPMMLSSRHRKEVMAILARHAPNIEVLAYGSRVTGRAQACSDLDLALREPKNPMRPTGLASAVREAFVESLLPFSVDVCEWALIPESFRQTISARHIRLQGS
jgi:predicted nucleotidyltransferase